jgi:hypothetical protein
MASDATPISELDPRSAVLLLGSGFSLESTNLYGKSPPNGSGLRRHFIDELHFAPDTTYEIQVLAEEFESQSKITLFRELYNLFHITKIGLNQKAILSESWLRVYTTNYDDTVEMAHYELHIAENSYSNSDPLPNRLPGGSTIHLHGCIGRLTEDNVLEQLVLGESSYVRQYLSKSQWYAQFQGDLRFASNLFVIGYSLSDYHISALLLENPLLAIPEDPIFSRRTASYGKTLFIGLDGFATLLKTIPRSKPLSDLTKLKGFRLLDPLRDKKGLQPPTAIEIINLFVFGTFNYSRCAATLPNQTYVINRATQIKELIENLERRRSIIREPPREWKNGLSLPGVSRSCRAWIHLLAV